jgi:hypothetical protein
MAMSEHGTGGGSVVGKPPAAAIAKAQQPMFDMSSVANGLLHHCAPNCSSHHTGGSPAVGSGVPLPLPDPEPLPLPDPLPSTGQQSGTSVQ